MKHLFLLICLSITIATIAQTDTIFKLDGEVLNVEVAAIEENSVKYIYPGETFATTIAKNSISKIHFKSGRVQEFAPVLNLNEVKSCLDWKNVQIANFESEVNGLAKIDNVGTKAKGLTTLSSLSKLQDRAHNKLKMATAMLGGNVTYIASQNTEEAVFGGEYSSSKTPGVTLSGIAFTTQKVKPDAIKDGAYSVILVYQLRTNAYEMQQMTHSPQSMNIRKGNFYSENNFLKLKIDITSVHKVTEYTVIHADDSGIVLSGVYSNKRGKKTYYNVFLSRKNG